MNRLQKKCFIASAGLHLLLVVILVIGPAFLSKNKTEEMPTIDFVPTKLIDAAFSGGGNPNTRPPPPAPPAPPTPPQREVAPPEPKPEPKPEPVKPREPEAVIEPVKPPKPVVESLEARKEPRRPKPEVSTTPVPRSSETQKKADSAKKTRQPSETDTHAKELADARRRAAEAIGQTSRSLRADLSSTAIDINPGPGGGGEAYANFAQVVKSIYEHAWLPPDDNASDEAITKVTVTISRAGNVKSSRILRGSGDPSVDRSIQRTLDRVTFIAPFPEGTKDQERTFTINFNLKAKRLAG